MSLHLDKQELENIKTYKYRTNGLTFIEINMFEYFWNFMASILPRRLAPNLLTLSGLIVPLLSFFAVMYYDWTFSKVLPNWVFILAAAALFWYQTIDAIDGK